MKNTIHSFYDSLSEDYHLIYNNWDKSIYKQSKILSSIIENHSKISAKTILDCTCGIGTQSLGLSNMGYKVHGTDISEKSIKRAKFEAKKRGLTIQFEVADLLALGTKVSGKFDVVISCDNSLPHLVDEEELKIACSNILSKLKDEGLFIGSVRDYNKALQEKKKSTAIIRKSENGNETISFQLWDWNPDNTYIVNHFTLKGKGSAFETSVRKTKYRAYTRLELNNIFKSVGFKNIAWLMPNETGYFQPIIIGSK